jgi:phosphoserine phosphatase
METIKREGIFYNPATRKIFLDLNKYLADEHLGWLLLKEIGEEKNAKKIWNEKRNYRERIEECAKLLKGKSLEEISKISEKIVEKVNLRKNSEKILIYAKDNEIPIIIFTGTPFFLAHAFVWNKIRKIYPYPQLFATILEIKNGYLTGNCLFIPDEEFRKFMIEYF